MSEIGLSRKGCAFWVRTGLVGKPVLHTACATFHSLTLYQSFSAKFSESIVDFKSLWDRPAFSDTPRWLAQPGHIRLVEHRCDAC